MPNKFVTGPEIISGSYNGSFYRSNNKLCCSNCHNASLVPKIERESFSTVPPDPRSGLHPRSHEMMTRRLHLRPRLLPPAIVRRQTFHVRE